MSIYTKTGDRGETFLFGGKRVLKCDELVDVYGSVDELNSWLGLVISGIESVNVREFLQLIQADLFTIGSNLAGWKSDLKDLTLRVKEMEIQIDKMEKDLPKLTNFVLPGGNKFAAKIHILRSICRRVERQTVALVKMSNDQIAITNKEGEIIIKYLNRLSDLFFILARFINKQANEPELIWSGIKKK